jgi:Fe-S cluster assembly protein SufD
MTASVRVMRTAAEESLLRAFAEAKDELPGVAAKRAAGIAAFESAGLPHRRIEEWKYTDLRAAMRDAQPLAAAPSPEQSAAAAAMAPAFPALDAATFVFVNGRHVKPLDSGAMPRGVQLRDLHDALTIGDRLVEAHLGRLTAGAADALTGLNTAFMSGGAVVHVDAQARPERPIHLDFRFVGSAASIYPRLLIVVGDGADVTLIESHRGPEAVAYQSNGVAEIVIGKGAKLTHVKLQAQGESALHLSNATVEIGADATYETFTLEEGAATCRRDLSIRFAGEGAALRLNGATLAARKQHIDTTLVVDHAVPNCTSQEIYKYVLAGEARGVFQGKIIVRPDAQKTDGRMSARGLLLEDGPEFDAKPELEIYADDVQCAHGATAGAIDENLMFYLLSRGIPPGEAKAMLVSAFVGEALEAVSNDAVRDSLSARIEAWLTVNLH